MASFSAFPSMTCSRCLLSSMMSVAMAHTVSEHWLMDSSKRNTSTSRRYRSAAIHLVGQQQEAKNAHERKSTYADHTTKSISESRHQTYGACRVSHMPGMHRQLYLQVCKPAVCQSPRHLLRATTWYVVFDVTFGLPSLSPPIQLPNLMGVALRGSSLPVCFLRAADRRLKKWGTAAHRDCSTT